MWRIGLLFVDIIMYNIECEELTLSATSFVLECRAKLDTWMIPRRSQTAWPHWRQACVRVVWEDNTVVYSLLPIGETKKQLQHRIYCCTLSFKFNSIQFVELNRSQFINPLPIELKLIWNWIELMFIFQKYTL